MAFFSTYRAIIFIIMLDILVSLTTLSFYVALFPSHSKAVSQSFPALLDFTSWKFFAQPIFSGLIFVLSWRFAAPRVPSISVTAKGIRFAILLAMYSELTFGFHTIFIMETPLSQLWPAMVDRTLRALLNGFVLSQLYRPTNVRKTHFM
ncbi:hypothetical protein J8273_2200 [Carpediemonas membranifera]|uniref:Uncharacterized protein n=1 Tax=Carpediemonas membranifera TaxID=201153 RepID=A0A8J6BA22_9EUKA|nr:hypothetical protein J8273_2200 [Carpediemonas membranifera]|eukprot:KAG9395867.1 hypothetical protein J8273_2200 [Carpediemonas membranifera]